MFSFCYIEVSIGKLLQQCGITLGAKDVSEKLRDNIAGNLRKHSLLLFDGKMLRIVFSLRL